MLPREIQKENWPDRAKYDLPIRPIGALHWVGVVPIGFALLLVGIPGRFAWPLLQNALQGRGGAMAWIIVAFLSLFIAGATTPTFLGLCLLVGRVRLVATKEKLIVTEIAGPFR